MKRIKVISLMMFLAATLAAVATDSSAYPPFLKVARKFGAKDCTFCHLNPEGGEPFGERAKWLVAEKQKRAADVVDPEWLAQYKPADAKTDKKSDRKSPLEQELMKLEVEWADAIKKHDHAALSRILADEFILTDEVGNVFAKSQYIQTSADATIDSYNYDDVSVRTHRDTAVVAARWTIKGSFKGAAFSGEFRETDVWIKKDGRWQVLASHISRVAKQ